MFISQSPTLRTTGKTINGQPDVCCLGLTSTSGASPTLLHLLAEPTRRLGGNKTAVLLAHE